MAGEDAPVLPVLLGRLHLQRVGGSGFSSRLSGAAAYSTATAINCGSHFVRSFLLATISKARAQNLVRAGTQPTADLGSILCAGVAACGQKEAPKKTTRSRTSARSLSSPKHPGASPAGAACCALVLLQSHSPATPKSVQ
jgi:hypothetical protein